ncbi:MAG: hypothetical protein BYD32DRAFT_289973 [Podila humilis]|nr:MAG: hypothetical protein BYD32DRAFT_289973 [Podila humilis]
MRTTDAPRFIYPISGHFLSLSLSVTFSLSTLSSHRVGLRALRRGFFCSFFFLAPFASRFSCHSLQPGRSTYTLPFLLIFFFPCSLRFSLLHYRASYPNQGKLCGNTSNFSAMDIKASFSSFFFRTTCMDEAQKVLRRKCTIFFKGQRAPFLPNPASANEEKSLCRVQSERVVDLRFFLVRVKAYPCP